jgi:hypothetical protein
MPLLTDFQGIIRGRKEWVRNHGTETTNQYADLVGAFLARPVLKTEAETQRTADMLRVAWEALKVERGGEINPTGELAKALHGPVDTLFSTDETHLTSDQHVKDRIAAFANAATHALAELERKQARPTEHPIQQGGALVIIDDKEVETLYNVVRGLVALIRATGRQTTEDTWSQWFAQKWETIKTSFPSAAHTAASTVASKLINDVLNVGLLPVMGTNVITFGSNVLTPLNALITFPGFMRKQAGLYALRDYAKKQRMLETHNVYRALQAGIDSVDIAAVQTAFKVTPIGLLITIYTGAKKVAELVHLKSLTYATEGGRLVDAADTLFAGTSATLTTENTVAMMAILHLCDSNPDKFFELMTCRVARAKEEVAKKLAT